ncbi:hypothetical protein [Halogeometricum luteum]|uniref:Uncharacterized protein n=1 Tax=Halogeometricum luteum TaxID=2950537 RepID=A0ABU2G8G5_9EURY|nr:hypothetical protein [Halogeometricum sp. S3BR5-2]MDS0297107.1 hypothetical protein [Halogeometricum sp. S3BR5-2]
MVDCSTFTSNPFADGGNATEFLDAAICTYQMDYGMVLPGSIVWFTVISMMYIRTQSIVMPVIITLLVGAPMITLLPSTAQQMIATGILGGGSALFVLLLQRLDT